MQEVIACIALSAPDHCQSNNGISITFSLPTLTQDKDDSNPNSWSIDFALDFVSYT